MNNETKFTKGEWSVESECWLEDHIPIGAPGWGAMTLVAYRGNESTANAHLIAAAPELYHALERLCSETGDIDLYSAPSYALEALKKARGEQ